MNTLRRIAIIGGGAAGFMSAITAKETNPNASIHIFEKTNKLLTKVLVSGGGRCNVTNATFSIPRLIKNYPRGGKQLRNSFNYFHTNDTVSWFEDKGVKLKTEEDGRIFPKSNTSKTIFDIFLRTSNNLDVRISENSEVTKIIPKNNIFKIVVNNEVLSFDRVVITTGGSQRRINYNWLDELGYRIEDTVPSLFTFNLKNKSICNLMGLSVPNAITAIKGTKLKNQGSLLITHWGFSGPAILKLSSWGARELADLNYNFRVGVNWLGINENQLRNKLEDILCSRKLIYKHNPFEIPKRLWHYILKELEIKEKKVWGELAKKERNRLINKLTNDEFDVSGKTTFKEEFVSCGGVCLSQVNMNTMESKVHKGLYFGGEVLDIDGVTGGFNFQAAWTTGFLAGKNSAL